MLSRSIVLLLCIIVLLTTTTFAQEVEKLTTIIVIRHAEKANDPENSDPDLSPDGLKRAHNIAKMFSKVEINTIYTTNYKRTKQTVAPLAKAKNLQVDLYSPADENQYAEILKKHKGEKIVICGHSNTVPRLLNYFSQSDRYKVLAEEEFDKAFIVSLSSTGAYEILKLVVE